jgi:hypothetical protein
MMRLAKGIISCKQNRFRAWRFADMRTGSSDEGIGQLYGNNNTIKSTALNILLLIAFGCDRVTSLHRSPRIIPCPDWSTSLSLALSEFTRCPKTHEAPRERTSWYDSGAP